MKEGQRRETVHQVKFTSTECEHDINQLSYLEPQGHNPPT